MGVGCEGKVEEAFGQICWLEVPILEPERAKKFYTELFGWKFSDHVAPGAGDCVKGLHMFTKDKLNGALMHVEKQHQVANVDPENHIALPLLPTLCVRDCTETLDKAVEFGGRKIFPRTEIGNGMGYFARVLDTEGNLVGIWSQV